MKRDQVYKMLGVQIQHSDYDHYREEFAAAIFENSQIADQAAWKKADEAYDKFNYEFNRIKAAREESSDDSSVNTLRTQESVE
jgi:hypothetical protein